MFVLNVFGAVSPGMARAAAGTGGVPRPAFSSLAAALSLALRLVVARGWAVPAPSSTGRQVGISCWMNAGRSCSSSRGESACSKRHVGAARRQQAVTPRSRDPSSNVCLFRGGNSGIHAGQHNIDHRTGKQSPSFGSPALRGGNSFEPGADTHTTSAGGRSRSQTVCAGAASTTRALATAAAGAGAADVLPGEGSAASTGGTVTGSSGVEGDEGAAVAGAGGGVGCEEGSEGGLGELSPVTLKSLRTARDRGDLKQKSREQKNNAEGRESSSSPLPDAASSRGRATQGGTKLLRLSKLLADRAIGTRSEVDALVRRGRVRVDGKVIKSPKTKLPVDCVIELDGKEYGPVPLLVAFHKPKGVITSLSDEWDRDDLSDVLPKSLLLKHHPVGRLDADSSGLLLLSSDGALTHKLLSPRFEVEREYVVTVDVPAKAEEPGGQLVAALHAGVRTADGVYRADVPGIDGREVRVVVREGKNRMVRRMLANAGYPVLELRRERYGKIHLGGLPVGEHTPVAGEALEWAKSVL